MQKKETDDVADNVRRQGERANTDDSSRLGSESTKDVSGIEKEPEASKLSDNTGTDVDGSVQAGKKGVDVSTGKQPETGGKSNRTSAEDRKKSSDSVESDKRNVSRFQRLKLDIAIKWFSSRPVFHICRLAAVKIF